MKKTLLLVALPLLLLSCDLSNLQILDGEKASREKNTFVITDAMEEPSSFTLLITGDQHFGRRDDGVYYANDLFFSWVRQYQSQHTESEDHLTHMVSLGDSTNNSRKEEFQAYSNFTLTLLEEGITTYSIKGNHDIRLASDGIALWKTYVDEYNYQGFSHRGVSFYLLDTANRTLGRTQMHELQDAVKRDSRPKLFFSHMPLYGNASLIYLVLGNTQERENLIRLMVENSAKLFLSGHHHQGDIWYSFRRTTSEFIAGAFHGRDSFIETTKPRWYLLHFDVPSNCITVVRYQVEKDQTVTEKLMETFPIE